MAQNRAGPTGADAYLLLDGWSKAALSPAPDSLSLGYSTAVLA